MKILVPVLVVLMLFFCVLVYGLAGWVQRARFASSVNELKAANADWQRFGMFTNGFRNMRVYAYTNLLTVGGTNYQCVLAVESAALRERGFLAVTTNQTFVWVDKQRGPIPLDQRKILPPGW